MPFLPVRPSSIQVTRCWWEYPAAQIPSVCSTHCCKSSHYLVFVSVLLTWIMDSGEMKAKQTPHLYVTFASDGVFLAPWGKVMFLAC